MKFKSTHPHYHFLKNKWASKHSNITNGFLEKHKEAVKNLTLGGLGGAMLLNAANPLPIPPPNKITISLTDTSSHPDVNKLLSDELKEALPRDFRNLNISEEDKVAEILSKEFGMPIKAELAGIKLNRTYGMIGGEQHLYRYPGDSLSKHAENVADWAMYASAGIAPGLGAWGYFAISEKAFTQKDKDRERYYIAVQTFLSPGFAENFGRYKDFFKYRKMLVVNSKTGQSVVAVIGDAGPSEWTGKHLGGSPEVMHFLGLGTGPRKGEVLYFFIDDPDDKIPLGPIVKKTGLG